MDAATPERREGRGRLSSIEMLPEECDEDIAWALTELRERKMPQSEILRQFNARLADRGIRGISKGAFSRYSLRVAAEMRKLDASRRIMDAVMSRIAPGERSESMIAATELLKYLLMELVMSADHPDPKLLGDAALSLQRLSATAARESEVQRRDRRDQAARDAEQAAHERAQAEAAEAAEAATRIGKEAGLSAERLAEMRRGILKLAG